MATAAQRVNAVGDPCGGANQEQDNQMSQTQLTALTVAELKTLFQGGASNGRTESAVEAAPSSLPSVKERLQQLRQSPPSRKAPLGPLPPPSPKKSEKQSPRVVAAVAKKATGATSQASEAAEKKTKPTVVCRKNATGSPLAASPCKKASADAVEDGGDAFSNANGNQSAAAVGRRDGPPVAVGGANLKPNPSHLSAFIDEIRQQQSQLLSSKPGKNAGAVARAASSSSTEGGSPPPTLPPAPPVPPPRLPGVASPALQSHARNVPTEGNDGARQPPPPHSKWRRKPLPALSQLGAPPPKPKRPPKVKIASGANVAEVGQTPPLPQRNPTRSSCVPNIPPLRPYKSIPMPPTSERQSSRDSAEAPSSPIPEFTEEEELAGLDGPDELYDDTGATAASSVVSASSARTSLTLQADELYQDASIQQPDSLDELYEDVGAAEANGEQESLIYAAKKEDERKKKENDRKMKKLQKENEKKQKDMDKQRKKFNLTGDEVAVEMGVVKEATKGWRKEDLSVRKGETISILRISDTPSGKWLVQNEDGKVGYVDLTNIEVMTQAKPAQVSSEDSASEIYDDGVSEAIYEVIATMP